MEDTVMVELKFAGDAYAKLANLQKQLHVETPTDVIWRALGVLAWATNHLEQQHKILAEDTEGKQVEVTFPFLQLDT